MDKDLILLTAALRLDNLPLIARSIANQQKQHPEFKLFWLICIDQYNAYSTSLFGPAKKILREVDQSEFQKIGNYLSKFLLDNFGIPGAIYMSGKNQEKNYGGDLFNEPLIALRNSKEFENKNPLVYVLDDDNILHPLLLPTINKIISQGVDIENKFIWLTKRSAYGYVAEAFRENAYAEITISENEWKCYEVFCADPSQMLCSFNDIFEWQPDDTCDYPGAGANGMFPNEFEYDSKLYLGQWWQNPNKFVFFPEWIDTNEFVHDIPATYHNGLVTKDEFDELYANIHNTDKAVEMNITISCENGVQRMIPINDVNFMLECLRKDQDI